jgi:hypothetical protein
VLEIRVVDVHRLEIFVDGYVDMMEGILGNEYEYGKAGMGVAKEKLCHDS